MEVDFRILQSFKNQLYGSPYLLLSENKLPLEEFERIRGEHDSHLIRSSQVLGTILAANPEPCGAAASAKTEPCSVLREITDAQSGLVDLNMFSDLLDLFPALS